MKTPRGKFSVIYIGIVLILLYVPMMVVVAYSFNASKTGAVWTGFTLNWYSQMAADDRLIESLVLSLQIALVSALVSCVLGTMGAVTVAKYSERAKKAVSLLLYIPLVIPEIITGVALLMFFSVTPLNYGMLTIILSHTTFCIPYVFILVSIRLRTVDAHLLEAARDLGAKPVKAFGTVTLPLILPAVLSGALLSMAMSLDDVVISSFVSGPQSVTLPIRIYSMLKLGVSPKINALSTVMLFVTFLAIGLLQVSRLRKKNSGDA